MGNVNIRFDMSIAIGLRLENCVYVSGCDEKSKKVRMDYSCPHEN